MYSEKQREEKKKQILEKSLELFVKQGLENTSLNDLAKYCNTYKAALYNYFTSKDEIVCACAEMYMKSLGETMFSGMNHTEKDIHSAMLYGFNIFADEKKNMRFVYQVISSPKYGEQCRKVLTDIYREYLGFSDMLAEHFALNKEEFRACYLLFLTTIHDYGLWEDTELIKEKVEYIFKLIDRVEKEK